MRDLVDGASYLSIFQGLIEAGRVLLLSPNENLMQKAYAIAVRNEMTVYDAVFVSLALEMGLALRTFDKVQVRVMRLESGRSEAAKRS